MATDTLFRYDPLRLHLDYTIGSYLITFFHLLFNQKYAIDFTHYLCNTMKCHASHQMRPLRSPHVNDHVDMALNYNRPHSEECVITMIGTMLYHLAAISCFWVHLAAHTA